MSYWAKPSPMMGQFLPAPMQGGNISIPMAPAQQPQAFQRPSKPDEKKPMDQPFPMMQQMPPQLSMFGATQVSGMNLSPEQQEYLQSERQRVRTLMDEAVNRRSGALEQMRENLRGYQQKKPGVDWTGATMLIDMLNKGTANETNFTNQYQQSSLRPESDRQRSDRIQQMQKDIDLGEQRLLDSEIRASKESLRGLKDLFGTQNQKWLMREKQKGVRQLQNQAFKNLREDEKFLGKVTDDYAGTKNEMDFVVSALEEGSFQRVNQALSKMARLAGEVGTLTDRDINRQMMNTLEQRVRETYGKTADPNTPISPVILKQMKEAMNAMIDAAREEYATKVQTRLDRTQLNPLYSFTAPQSKPVYDQTLNRINKDLQAPFNTEKSEKEQIMEELRRLKGE